jgi:hypothetical protein
LECPAQVTTNLSPTNKYSTILPLTIVFLITLIKEGVEDLKRFAFVLPLFELPLRRACVRV